MAPRQPWRRGRLVDGTVAAGNGNRDDVVSTPADPSAGAQPTPPRRDDRISLVIRVTTYGVVAAVGVALLHLAHLDIAALLFTPLLLALVIPGDGTLFLRAVLATGALFSVNLVLALLLNWGRVPFISAVTTMIIVVPLAAALGAGRATIRVGRPVNSGDVFAALAGAVVFVLLWLPGHADDAAGTLNRLIATGEDNAGHLSIVQAIVLQHGHLFDSAARLTNQILEGQATYPPGFHLNVALITMAINNFRGGPNAARLVHTYYEATIALQAFWALTVVMAIRAVAAVRGVRTGVILVLAVAVALFFVFGPPSGLWILGAHAESAALWLFTGQLLAATAPQLDNHPLLRLQLTALGVIGVTWSWYLLTPLALIPLAGVIWVHRRTMRRLWMAAVGVVFAAGALSLPPVYYGAKAGAAAAINLGGSTLPVDRVFIAALILGAVASMLLPRRSLGYTGRAVATASLGGVCVEALVLHVHRITTVGAAGYYYEKTLYAVAVVAAIAAAAGGLTLFSGRSTGIDTPAWRRAALTAVCVGLVWLSTGLLSPDNVGRLYLEGNYRIRPDVGAMRYLIDSQPPPADRQVLFWGATEPVFDYYHSRFASAVYLRNNQVRQTFLGQSTFHQDDGALLALVRASPAGYRLISRDAHLRDQLIAAGFTPADLSRVDIVTLTEPEGGPAGPPPTNYDITPRVLLPWLFAEHLAT